MNGVLVDAGPLVAIVDRGDNLHQRFKAVFESIDAPLFTVWPAVTEAVYLLGRVSVDAQRIVLGMIESEALRLLPLGCEDAGRLAELMEKYEDLPMDLADAALVRVAERERIRIVVTADARDFRLYRPAHIRNFEVLSG